MRLIPVALLIVLGSSLVQAAQKSEPFLKRGKVMFDQARTIADKADRAGRPAQRHVLLGRAKQSNTKAREMAMAACRVMTPDNRARVLAFQRSVWALDVRILKGRAQFRATTDIVVQKVNPYRPNSTIIRQAARLGQLQKLRIRATDTRANVVRRNRRIELNRWRAARIAARLRNGIK